VKLLALKGGACGARAGQKGNNIAEKWIREISKGLP